MVKNIITCFGMIMVSNEVGLVYELPSPPVVSPLLNLIKKNLIK